MQFAPGAWRLAAVPAVLAIPALLLSPLASLSMVAVAGGILYSHRDPDRNPPDSGIVAPADGRITVLREEAIDNSSRSEGSGTRVRVGVFMGLTDVHVNRAPMAGRVSELTHEPGGHRPAFSKASDRNERVLLDCGDYAVVLVAGALARRIHPYVAPGDVLERGQRIGHISFGSRADVIMPPEIGLRDVQVAPEDRVRAGETVLAVR